MADRVRNASPPPEECLDHDALLAHVLRRATPHAFRHMPAAEQRWRARMLLMTWVLSHHDAFAWSMALADDSDDGARNGVESIDDWAIEASMRGADREPIDD